MWETTWQAVLLFWGVLVTAFCTANFTADISHQMVVIKSQYHYQTVPEQSGIHPT